MRIRKLVNIRTLVIIVVTVFLGCSNPNGKANRLFVEASQLVEQGQKTEDYQKRLKLYRKALSNLSKILSEYPSSELAKDLIQERAKLSGRITMGQFKEYVILFERIVALREDPIEEITNAILNSKPVIYLTIPDYQKKDNSHEDVTNS